ncbi:pilin [soil metagenome]
MKKPYEIPAGRGFTVLELMVVIAVIGILAMMAMPSYFGRIAREQIQTAWPLVEIAKKPIAAAWANTQIFPLDNASAGLPAADKIVGTNVSAVEVQDGAIHITFGNRASNSIAGKIVTLRPAVVEDAPIVPVAWVCAGADVPKKMRVRGVDRTNVPLGVLPLECRKLGP